MADPVVNCVPPHPNAHLTDAEIMDRLKALTPPPTPDAVALVDALIELAADPVNAELNSTDALNAARAAVLAAMRPIPPGSVVVPQLALDALYMRLWKRHEHLDDGLPDFEPVRQPWTAEDDAALKAVAKYLFAAAPEAPR